jgi:FAD/FMN-containing dehydrogenase
VLRREDPLYEEARRVWNGAIDRRPAAILVCARAADVAEGVRFAAAEGLRVTLRGGGHNVAGRSLADGALLVDLSALRDVQVDPRARRALVAGGATWRELDAATSRFGLATPGGMVSSTGVGGLTLGGGIGWLMRRYGLTVDNWLSAEVVLADGRQVTVSASENPRLFWGLRGGGGPLAAVTRLELALHPASTVIGGALWTHAARARDVLRVWREFLPTTPENLTMVAAICAAPPAPFIPPALRMQPAIAQGGCWCGELEEGQRVLQRLADAVKPDANAFAAQPYALLQTSLDPTAPSGAHYYWKSHTLAELSDELLDWLAARALELPTPETVIHVHQLGGAVARGDDGDLTASLRQSAFVANVVGCCLDARDLPRLADWVRSAAAVFGPETARRPFVNFSDASDPIQSGAYSSELQQRLSALKRDIDPAGTFV